VRPLARRADDSCLMYVVRVPAAQRERIRGYLAERGIATSVHYPSLARHPLFRRDTEASPNPVEHDESLVTLPSFLEMTAAQQHAVAEALACACSSLGEASLHEPSAVA
jgi:dTDP-4-amino-4,6-dideoxygalactose transaminase